MSSSVRYNSADGVKEIRISLSQLKSFSQSSKFRKSNSNIEEELLKKHKKSKETLDKKRMKEHANEIQDLKFIPRINEKSNKIIHSRHTKEVEKLLEKIERAKFVNSPVKVPQPQAPILPPDLPSVIDMFKSRTYLRREKTVEKINPSKLNLIEKGKFFEEKSKNARKEAELRKAEELMKDCTFRPDLSKPNSRVHSLGSEFLLTEEKSRPGETTRSPAPKPKAFKSPTKQPTNDLVYSFKEGVNIKDLLSKSKPLLTYNLNPN